MLNRRLKNYIVLIVISYGLPFLVTMTIIIATGDRMIGMKNFMIPSIILIHLIFSLTQLKTSFVKKIIYTLVAASIATGLTLIPISMEYQLNIDIYGYWDMVTFFGISSLVTWELLNQIDKRITKNYSQQAI